MKQDWKKTEKQIYLPKTEPITITIPPFKFFTIEGKGNPNDKFFAEYIGVLYSLAYGVKMSPKNGFASSGYFEYRVYPLEGVWDISEEARNRPIEKFDKNTLVFKLMIRQPEFVSEDFANDVIAMIKKKKPHPLLDIVKFEVISEGDCIQMMHIGSYDNEPESFKKMEDYCQGLNFSRESKIHREIYLSDARKVSPDKLRTVLRFRIQNGLLSL